MALIAKSRHLFVQIPIKTYLLLKFANILAVFCFFFIKSDGDIKK